MLSNLLEICHKFLQLNALFEKLSYPTAKIYVEDLECLNFSTFRELRRCDRDEDLVWALRILAEQAGDTFGKRYVNVKERGTRKELDALQQFQSMLQVEATVKMTWLKPTP
jgi:hypothetical protein